MDKKSYRAKKADTNWDYASQQEEAEGIRARQQRERAAIPQGLSSGKPRYDKAAEKFRMDASVLINDLREVENAIPKNLRQAFEKVSDIVQRDILDAAHRVDVFGSRIYQNLMR